jgi:hypothetical protein
MKNKTNLLFSRCGQSLLIVHVFEAKEIQDLKRYELIIY